jgi:hypothetical protein
MLVLASRDTWFVLFQARITLTGIVQGSGEAVIDGADRRGLRTGSIPLFPELAPYHE